MKRIPKAGILASCLIAGLSSTLCAVDYTWDPSPEPGVQYGDGVWNTSTTNWTTNGGASNVAWTNGANKVLFPSSAGATSLTTQTLTLGSNIVLEAIDMGGGYGSNVVITDGGSNYTLSLGGSRLLANNNTNRSLKIDATVSGTNGLLKSNAGTVILSKNNTYSGVTEIRAGTLRLEGSGSNTIANSSQIWLNGASGRLDVTQISATGGFALVQNQTLRGNGTILGNLTAGAGSSVQGRLTFEHTLRLENDSSTTLTILSATDFDKLSGAELLIVGGILNLEFGSGFSDTGVFQLFDFDSISGSFSSVSISGLSAEYQASFDALSGSVSVTAVPEPSAIALYGALAALGLACLRRRKCAR